MLFTRLYWCEDTRIVTWSKSTISIWTTLDNKVNHIVSEKNNITYVFADDECIISGNLNGILLLRNPQTGEKLYTLNMTKKAIAKPE